MQCVKPCGRATDDLFKLPDQSVAALDLICSKKHLHLDEALTRLVKVGTIVQHFGQVENCPGTTGFVLVYEMGEKDVGQRILGFGSLVIVILWLVLSYLPPQMVTLPNLGFTASWTGVFVGLLLAGLVVFVLLQLDLTRASARFFQSERVLRHNDAHGDLVLRRSVEVIWTALPILMTLGVAWLAYFAWQTPTGR